MLHSGLAAYVPRASPPYLRADRVKMSVSTDEHSIFYVTARE